MRRALILQVGGCMLALSACTDPVVQPPEKSELAAPASDTRFRQLTAESTGIHFANKVVETADMNPFSFFNVYNGGGVAAADFDNDGLCDLYFTANQQANKLYKNLGNLRFEEVSEAGDAAGKSSWTTGVTVADVNADGWLDLLVCQSGPKGCPSEELRNLLLINNQNLTFTDRAAEFGLDDPARSNHATFFDYDRDGDLDLYVVNHPTGFGDYIAMRVEKAKNPGNHETDKLFRNNGDGSFTDVTDAAGLRNYAFGLSVTTADFNNDGWLDLYVANDYSEPDHHYQNNGDGTFTDVVNSTMKHISQFSMGSDAADINNDGLMDLLVVDMMAEDNRRKKTNMQGMDRMAFYQNFALGRHFQYMQNALQLNRDNGHFSEIAELSGISYTDWSWAPLFCDLDNDGLQDVFITNGMRRDIRANDFLKKLNQLPPAQIAANFERILAEVPVEPIDNYVYRNTGDLHFEKMNAAWKLSYTGFSNGAAYADLDNDGDLDLVTNNLEAPASVFENAGGSGNSIRVRLKGPAANLFGIGTRVALSTEEGTQTKSMILSRGFQSAVEPVLHFGLGKAGQATKIVVTWPDGKKTHVSNAAANTVLTVSYADAAGAGVKAESLPPLLADVTKDLGVDFKHNEVFYEDYDKEVLLPHRYSQLGPFISVGDVDSDGFEDFFVGGGAGQAGVLYLQDKDGKFSRSYSQPWKEHAASEDMGSTFFDADNDGDLDLYVTSGSNQWPEGNVLYRDRLYFNDGKGTFVPAPGAIPAMTGSNGCVAAADFDTDGDLDLFVGGRVIPGAYPHPASSALLVNDGGKFVDGTATYAQQLADLGLVTAAEWADMDGDSDLDLVVAGEWMPVTIFENKSGSLEKMAAPNGLSKATGWWYSLATGDFDNDGDLDIVAGNLGLNSRYQTRQGPIEVFSGDLDGNGSNDIVLAYHQEGVCFPVRGRTCSSEQMPGLKATIPTYEQFGGSSVFDVYGSSLEAALNLKASWLASAYIENKGDGRFEMSQLPVEAQLSAVNGIVPADVNGDGHLDLVLAGNLWGAEVETARHDASVGQVLLGDGANGFDAVPAAQTGYFGAADVKSLQLIRLADGKVGLVVGANAGPIKVMQVSQRFSN